MERQLNPKDGNASRSTVTFSTLHSWRQRGRVSTESEDEDEETQEKPQESGQDSRFIGIIVGSKKEKRKINK